MAAMAGRVAWRGRSIACPGKQYLVVSNGYRRYVDRHLPVTGGTVVRRIRLEHILRRDEYLWLGLLGEKEKRTACKGLLVQQQGVADQSINYICGLAGFVPIAQKLYALQRSGLGRMGIVNRMGGHVAISAQKNRELDIFKRFQPVRNPLIIL